MEFRQKCKEFALKYVEIQREEFKRLGVRGEWDNPYLTLKPYFEARQIGAFGEMAKKGYIYKGLKPVYWCASCETALAEAEVEYDDKRSASIYVRFPVCNGRGSCLKRIPMWSSGPPHPGRCPPTWLFACTPTTAMSWSGQTGNNIWLPKN